MIVIYKFVGKKTAYEFDLKENANCPDSEKSGTGPGSCGGATKDKTQSSTQHPHPDAFATIKKVGKLDKVNPVIATEASKEFAKMYTASESGNFKQGGPSEQDSKAAEEFYNRFKEVTGEGRSGFAGAGETYYEDIKSGKYFKVSRSPNGKTFYGTDHVIREATDPRTKPKNK